MYFFPFNQESLDPELSFSEKMEELLSLKNELQKKNCKPLKIVISGAGPAGLIRAIQAILEGNLVSIIEKRLEDNIGRENPIILNETSIQILKKYGVYQFLIENKKIDQKRRKYLCASLKDIESAMKCILQEISPETVIIYHSLIEEIDLQPQKKINLVLETSVGTKKIIDSLDILLITEGGRARTLKRVLQTQRKTLLPSIFLIMAATKTKKNEMQGLFFRIKYFCKFFSYFFVFIYKFALEGFGLFPNRSDISFLFPLKTLKASFLTIVLSKKRSELLKKKHAKCLHKHLNHWIMISIWYAVYYKLFSKFRMARNFRCNDVHSFRIMFKLGVFPYERFVEFESSVTYETEPSRRIGCSVCLVAGDALITIDPLVGLGCNSTIKNSVYFLQAIQSLSSSLNIDQVVDNYKKAMLNEVEFLYNKTVEGRFSYRPDAL